MTKLTGLILSIFSISASATPKVICGFSEQFEIPKYMIESAANDLNSKIKKEEGNRQIQATTPSLLETKDGTGRSVMICTTINDSK